MAQSVGAVALDIVMGKNTVASVVKNSMAEVQKVMADSSASIKDKVGAVGTACTNIGASLLPLTAKIGSVGIACAKMSIDFEDAMAKVSTIADTTEVPMNELQSQIMELSNQTGISSTEIADNVYNAISAGQKTGDAVNFVSNSTKLAKAGFADAGASLDVLTTIMNSYGLEADQVTTVSDMLIQTQNKGKTTVAELSSSMGKVIPTANAYGVGLDNICNGYAIMTANGIDTAESTTYMNSMLNELGKSSTGVAKVLQEQTGQSFKDLMDGGASLGDVLGILQGYCDKTGTQFSDLWGSAEAGKAALVMAKDGADGFNSALTDMQNCSGATGSAFEKMETTSYSLSKAVNSIKNTGIELGNTLMQTLGPIIDTVCSKVSQFTDWFGQLSDGQKDIIVKTALVVASIGPALIVVGKIITFVGTIISVVQAVIPVIGALNTVLMANPAILIVTAIVALIAGIVLLYNKCDWFRNAVNNIFSVIKDAFFTAFNAVMDFFTITVPSVFNKVVAFFRDNWKGILLFIVNPFAGAFKLLYDNCAVFRNFIDNFLNGIKNVISTVWNAILTFISAMWETIKAIFVAYFTIIKTVVTTYINIVKTVIMAVFNAIKLYFTTVFNLYKAVFTTAFSVIKSIVTGAVTTIKNVIMSVFNGVKDFIGGVMTLIKDIFSGNWGAIRGDIANILNTIKSTISNVFGNIKSGISGTMGNIKSAISNGFSSAFETIKNIPAQAVTWGKDMIQGIINGIKSMIGGVGSAVKSVADKIKSFLHFSVPDEGPLTDYESWMPDFMQGMASGITNNIPLIKDAVAGVSDNMRIGVQAPTIKGVTGTVKSEQEEKNDSLLEAIKKLVEKMDNPDDDKTPIQIIFDGRLIDEYQMSATSRKIIRSGGMA